MNYSFCKFTNVHRATKNKENINRFDEFGSFNLIQISDFDRHLIGKLFSFHFFFSSVIMPCQENKKKFHKCDSFSLPHTYGIHLLSWRQLINIPVFKNMKKKNTKYFHLKDHLKQKKHIYN